MKEVAREIMRKNSITRDVLESFHKPENRGKFLDFQHSILVGQNDIETSLIKKNCHFITDRGPDPLVFVEQHTADHELAMKLADSDAAKACLQRYRSSRCVVVIVCPLDTIEDDNVRMVPTGEEQIQYTEYLKRILKELKVPYKYCDKTDRAERLDWLESVINSSF